VSLAFWARTPTAASRARSGEVAALRLCDVPPVKRSGRAWWKKRWADAHRELLSDGADPTTLDKTAVVLGWTKQLSRPRVKDVP